MSQEEKMLELICKNIIEWGCTIAVQLRIIALVLGIILITMWVK